MEFCFSCNNKRDDPDCDEDEISKYEFLCFDCDNEFSGRVDEFRLFLVAITLTEYNLHKDSIIEK